MPTGSLCCSCGAEIPLDAVEGQCIRCLLSLAMSPRHLINRSWIGQMGNHELLNEIARGGMGIIYKARRLSDRAVVALKVLIPDALNSRVLEDRFINEVRASASLDHPHIIPTYDVGEEDGRHFFTMKYIEGVNLADRMKDTRFKPHESVRIVVAIADAVRHAHEHGILHRDIKPANILIDRYGRPWLGDFGVAKILHEDGDLTRTVAVLGTPAYLSPEQAMGRSKEVTERSDVFSLGAVFYELLAGQAPFGGGNSFSVLHQVIHHHPVCPSKLNPAVDAHLGALCLKALCKNPEDRYRSAGDFLQALCRYLQFEDVADRKNFTLSAAFARIRGNPRLAAAILGPALLLLGGVLGFLAAR